jgi:hypothetical protein
MFNALSRHPKAIAWFFVSLFYLDFIFSPVRTKAAERPLPLPGAFSIGIWKPKPQPGSSFNDNASRKTLEKVPNNLSISQRRKPAGVKGHLTTGPVQPETQSFQSVNTNNMVDLFTGDFSYNIPLLDVGGYPVSLHYQSGVSMDQEASWVGLGWNINPGSVNRNMRGLPDDFNGDKVTKTISVKPNRTVGVDIGGNIELYGLPINVNISMGMFHNTYKGWGIQKALSVAVSAGIGATGKLTGGLGISNNSQTGFNISPSMGFKLGEDDAKNNGSITIGSNYNSRTGIQALQVTGEVKVSANFGKILDFSVGTGINAGISFCKPSYTPTINIPYTSDQVAFTAKAGGEFTGLFSNGYIKGYASKQYVADHDKTAIMPTYGYMYYDQAGSRQNVLLDYNREKDIAYSDNAPHIAVPMYTYDTWVISGEGTGGMFRAYRGDIGFVFDHAITTKSTDSKISAELGFSDVFHGGVDLDKIYAATQSNAWTADNRLIDVIGFRSQDSTYENVYFKNPGEKTLANKLYHQALGDDYLMRTDLSSQGRNNEVVVADRSMTLFNNAKPVGKTTFDASTIRQNRDKRNQVISYLTADQATAVALDTFIKSYYVNSFPSTTCNTSNFQNIRRCDSSYRRPNHISEITVLNPDGRRYVYGIPVYNVAQVDVTMATAVGNNSTGLVSYTPGTDNNVKNNQGKDGYFSREALPPYAHSFLLSSILSPDYVDITGDGITEDDNGDAVKFNYSQIYSLVHPYQWRAPYDSAKASYNEGLKTDNYDERGSYSYGGREVWYLNSIESKTMIATFTLETDTLRKDGLGVQGENGGQDAGQRLYRLKQIDLYAKADFLKNGSSAKAIKTVHFDYSYDLCSNNPGSQGATGKLTLTRVWFTYNKDNRVRRNPYVFTYNSNNPGFNAKAVDRWGSYKNPSDNPGTTGGKLTNADYPYTLQTDSTKAAANVAAWTLSEIKLPSGGKIDVTYESDDYAYVQNKRAMQFFSVLGFGNSATDVIKAKLYPNNTPNSDYQYVFVKVSTAVTDKNDITRKYLDGVNQLFFKLAVNMPADNKGKGFEIIPVYADIDDYGITGTSNIIWIKVKPITGSQSPFGTAAIQFLRLNLPSKAYPFSEPGDNLDIRAVIGMLASGTKEIKNMINGFDDQARRYNWCNSVVTDKSFIRLDNPIYKKLGGGLRVKKVEIYDNWKQMTSDSESVYGQTYDYTTTTMINGVSTTISSGVASYEPMIGGDENPFHVPLKVYTEKVGALAPANYLYSEEPFAETFFPAPSVGYSKVSVQTIHKTRKSANGFEQTEFYTTKDFPTIVEYTPIDSASKKTYNPTLRNFLRIDAKHYVTLSQGFKVELNDMNGKIKSQASYSQTDSITPISYTYNYYKLQNDNAGQPRLSNTVSAVDSANGVIDTAAVIGEDIEVMVDVREQTSITKSGTIGENIDVVFPFPPITVTPVIPLPSSETNRYRAVAVLKVVNRYGILDSLIHIEKGSKVTTRNLVYDGETGDVLLSQTNNEFDDPVYNFNYPAHWAYTGMGPAYKNIGTVLKDVIFRKGIMRSSDGSKRIAVDRYFESGDEVLVWGKAKRISSTNDCCDSNYYQFADSSGYYKVWAIDASKGIEGQKGIYFVDVDGIPYSADSADVKIIRSGKRNMPGVSIGSVTSLASPIQKVSGATRLVFDSTTNVIAASAGRFKDFWKVDSTTYPKDTVINAARMAKRDSGYLNQNDNYSIHYFRPYGLFTSGIYDTVNTHLFVASAYTFGSPYLFDFVKSWIKFDFTGVPRGSIIQHARLDLYGADKTLHSNMRNTNACYLERLYGIWPGYLNLSRISSSYQSILSLYYNQTGIGSVETSTRVTLPETTPGIMETRNDTATISSMAQNMLDDYYNFRPWVQPAIRISLVDSGGLNNGNISRLAYNTWASQYDDGEWAYGLKISSQPRIYATYYDGCATGDRPTWATTPSPGYWCYDNPTDSFVCKANINDTAVNYYRFGILGNWRLDRAYTYYGKRKQSNPADTSNIRTDGAINAFMPYWQFSNTYLSASTDTMRWVWNSEITKVNSKGLEIENHDPLNRYNSGQYGYNQTLPIAVVQNAKNREIAFDGFEDYGYRTDTCKRCAVNRHIDLGTGSTLVDTVSHSGVYSLRVAGNQTVAKTFTIGTVAQDTVSPSLFMKEDSIAKVHTTINSSGTGLTVFYNHDIYCNYIDYYHTYRTLNFTSNIDYNSWNKPFPGLCSPYDFSFKFEGYIQPRYTGVYTFWGTADDAMSVYITRNGVTKDLTRPLYPGEQTTNTSHDWLTSYPTDTMMLQAGELYNITVLWDQGGGPYQALLEWESQGVQPQPRETVPLSQLYPASIDPATVKASTVTNDTTWCVHFENPTASSVTLNRFSPMQGKKMLVSAWVKQEMTCISGSYDSAQLQLVFNDGDSTTFTLHPSGNIIEGWQRIEDTVVIPPTATSCTMNMMATSSANVFFDDIRLHPFNANMKSFVYSPINLRLLAELDENNYATFYEYDDEGTLIRVKKETERGVKTIKESRSALIKQ